MFYIAYLIYKHLTQLTITTTFRLKVLIYSLIGTCGLNWFTFYLFLVSKYDRQTLKSAQIYDISCAMIGLHSTILSLLFDQFKILALRRGRQISLESTMPEKAEPSGLTANTTVVKDAKPALNLLGDSVVEQLIKWATALTSFDQGNYKLSLLQFQEFADISKLHFNVGMVAMKLKDSEEAVAAFNRAIQCDPYLAAAYFQKAAIYYYADDVETALECYQDCYDRLRSNTFINYSQLGLDYTLHAAHVIFNLALCFLVLGDEDRGMKYFNEALDLANQSETRPDTSKIQEAVRLGSQAPAKILPYEIPDTTVYRPQEDNIKNAKKVDYLGKSTVVAANNLNDNFDGFSGRQVKEMTLGRNYRKKNKTSPVPALPTTIPENVQINATLSRRAPTLSKSSNSSIRQRSSSVGAKPNYISLDDAKKKPVQITQRRSSLSQNEPYERRPGLAAESPRSEVSASGISIPNDMIRVKATFNDTRMILVPDDVIYDELLEFVRKKFKNQELLIKFLDESGQKCVMSNDDDLNEAIETAPNPSKLDIWCFVPSY
ncbi:Neutrophil cytosol factor 2 [Terramyces sp. JEL0728]|nr:Neutrophil cytosol factor 2 [Terramyces sp. JEL0728]